LQGEFVSIQQLGVGGIPAPEPGDRVVLRTQDSTGKLKITDSNVIYDGGGHTCGPIEIRADGVTVQNFRVRAGSQYGIRAEGKNITIQNNDIKDVKVSGDGDLNAITAFGDGLRILYNTAIDFVTGDPGDSHTDFFQTWISDGHPSGSRDVLIQGNKAIGPANPQRKHGIASIHQCIMAEGRGRGGNHGGTGDLKRWTISDNEFGDSWNQCIKLDGVSDVTITRNRFVGSSDKVVEVTDASSGVKFYADNDVSTAYGDVGVSTVDGPGPGAPPTTGGGHVKPKVAVGGANAPQNFEAVVKPDNSIILTWDPVPGATAITVRETASPDGVPGMPLPGSATTSRRTPHTLRKYTYWITATVDGVETAPSDTADVTLPFGSTDDGGESHGPTGTPAAILDIGRGATQNHFNVGIGYPAPGRHKNIPMADIVDDGFADPDFFRPNAHGDAVAFSVRADGRTTSNRTGHPRSELREMKANGTTEAAWNSASGRHVMSGISRITHLPTDDQASGTARPWICFAQIHDTENEALHLEGGDIVRLQVEGNFENGFKIRARTHSPNGEPDVPEVKKVIADSHTVGDDIHWKIECVDGTVKIYLDGVVEQTVTGVDSASCYFKAGNYQQFSTDDDDGGYPGEARSTVELRNLVVTHG
jgi:Alginate lyase